MNTNHESIIPNHQDTIAAGEQLSTHDIARQYLEEFNKVGEIAIIEGRDPDDVSDHGEVFELDLNVPGDAAVVRMEAGKHRISDIEKHISGEWELHIPIIGRARFWNGDKAEVINKGDCVLVEPNTPHFMVPDQSEGDYLVIVVSLPSYDPDNAISLSGDVFHQQLTEVERSTRLAYFDQLGKT